MAEPFSITSLLAAVILAATAGLNPYLPPMIVGVMTLRGAISLPVPYPFMGQTWFVALCALLFLANVFADKAFLPGQSLETPLAQRGRRHWFGVAYDVGQMLLGPLAGAVLVGATSGPLFFAWPLLALTFGALLAALSHAGKRAMRGRLAGRLGPFTNMLLSVAEDVTVVLLSAAALLLLSL